MLSLKNLTAAVALGAAMLVTPAMADAMPIPPAARTHTHTTYSVKHKKHKRKHRKHGHKHVTSTHKSATPASTHRHHPQV